MKTVEVKLSCEETVEVTKAEYKAAVKFLTWMNRRNPDYSWPVNWGLAGLVDYLVEKGLKEAATVQKFQDKFGDKADRMFLLVMDVECENIPSPYPEVLMYPAP